MKRKHFIAAAASVPLVAAAPAPPSPQPSVPSAKPSPPQKKVSAVARDLAERMRDFDPGLSDKQIEDIASGIDDNLKAGRRVNPKGRALKNSDEPVTTFEVPE